MPANPKLEQFRALLAALESDPAFEPLLERDQILLSRLRIEDVDRLLRNEAAYYFLIAAAGLNRTSLRRASSEPEAQIVAPRLRKAFVVRTRLPLNASFRATVEMSLVLREADLRRKSLGDVERLFRERLAEEQIPLLMSPPIRRVPGLLVGQRKPDGVYPDPSTGLPPRLYFEVKNVRRVADDIQKRLYEIAQAAIEMKMIYGNLALEGFAVQSTFGVEANPDLRARLRNQIVAAKPVVVALLICPKSEAERYRAGGETFVD